MSTTLLLVIILVIVLIGVAPGWSHSAGWGIGPFGILGTVLLVVLILMLFGKL